MDNTETSSPVTTPPPTRPATPSAPVKSRHLIRTSLLVILVIVLLAAAGGGSYYWQHQKLTAANTTIAKLKKQAGSLNSTITNLQAKNKQLNGQLTTYQAANGVSQNDLNITVDSAAYVNPYYGTPIGSTGFVGVDITIINPTKATIGLTTETMKLQDSQDNTYLPMSTSEIYAGNLPTGYSVLNDQSLTPNETVKGALVFEVPNTSLHSFELVNGPQTYPVTIP